MIYLLLAVLCSAGISLAMRLSEGYAQNKLSLLACNYVACMILAGFFTGWNNVIPVKEGASITLLLGCITGFLYLAAFLLMQFNIRKNGVVLSTTFMKLGVLVPTLTSIVMFREMPTLLQAIGFLIALVAIILIQSSGTKEENKFHFGLIILLIGGGLADFMSKIYTMYGNPDLEKSYLFFTFTTAFILCTILAICKKERLSVKDIFFGFLIGIPNYFSALFLLKSLGSIPAVVAYPSYSVGTIVLVTTVGLVFFHEKLTKRQGLALTIILAALVLLNV